MCGEQVPWASGKYGPKGSPPRVRGTDGYMLHMRRKERITPACAGNRTGIPTGTWKGKDHPRVCGEQGSGKRPGKTALGSPPRVRGTAPLPFRRGLRAGITPACAGNRSYPLSRHTLAQDHPRVCGEQAVKMPRGLPVPGSPPRVRGTGQKPPCRENSPRITPACAGNSARGYDRVRFGGDHPRVCGEQRFSNRASRYRVGSPPRVRGTVSASSEVSPGFRITPACAGNSRTFPPDRPRKWDHPRVCGEQEHDPSVQRAPEGSPPRVRGTEKNNCVENLEWGITPACAGNRRIPRRQLPGSRDHPRVCGEQLQIESEKSNNKGSPPRVRGTAGTAHYFLLCQRITPACAGNSAQRAGGKRPVEDHPRVCGEQPYNRSKVDKHKGSPPRVRGTDEFIG